MAELYFLRDGNGEDRYEAQGDFSLESVGEKLRGYKGEPSIDMPTILLNDENKPANPFADWRFVFIRISEDEKNKDFDKAGYYWLRDLMPESARRLVGL
jgi:hypothetical protein